MPTSTVEQYIKTIYQQEERCAQDIVQMKQLSEAMGVTPGTATAMVKHLAERKLIRYEPRKGVRLTAGGRELALLMVRRHRLIETFLENVLGYDLSEVHEDAEKLEHAVSDKFIERIDAYLGFPPADPHGDPIPSAEGHIARRDSVPLDHCETGDTIRVARLRNDDPAFLLLMKEQHLTPGEAFVVIDKNETAGTMTVRHDARSRGPITPFTISMGNSSRIMVEPTGTK
ncbi:MAG: metal-dependent transcriptional regulator [Spirochaetaceae bacterium]|nr:MAG: metal-dependent transcriptional regulator [Spirochaetaceae bacterium]